MVKKLFLMATILLYAAFFPLFCFADDGIYTYNDNGIYIFKISLKKYKDKIKPYVAQNLTSVSEVYNNGGYKLVVNGGYFDTATGAPISIVKVDGKTVETIFNNPDLLVSLGKNNRAEGVINRTELRILKDFRNRTRFDITPHIAPVPKGMKIVHSIQAGPMILPDLRLVEESFIKYNEGKIIPLAADVLKRRERTVIGLKNGHVDDYLYIIIFTKKSKTALNEVRDYCKKLGLEKAMNFDGGASTSINYNDIEIHSDTDNERKVKSFLVIEDDKDTLKDKAQTSESQNFIKEKK